MRSRSTVSESIRCSGALSSSERGRARMRAMAQPIDIMVTHGAGADHAEGVGAIDLLDVHVSHTRSSLAMPASASSASVASAAAMSAPAEVPAITG